MKITILQGAFLPVPPVLGGAVEKMWFALGKEFASKGHQVTYISRTYADTPSEEWADGIRHKRIQGYDTPKSGLYLKLLDLIYSLRSRAVIPKDSDIIITNTFWAPIVLPSDAKRICFVDVARMPKGQMRFYKNVACLRANSTTVANAIKAEIQSSQYHRVVNIPNPLPFQNCAEINFEKKRPVLLYTGRVHPEKGLELLIKAFCRLEMEWTLKIVGPFEISEGGGGKQYFKALKQIAETHRIEFIGPIFDIEVLNQFYEEASIFVYPSIAEKGETFGLAPLEAMAWGCVPVVSNLDCFKDFIIPHKNGLIFDHRNKEAVSLLSNSISQLVDNNEYRNNLARSSLMVRDTHSVSFIASEFLKEFDKIVKERKSVNTHS